MVAMISLAAIYTFAYHLVPWPTTIVAPDWGTWIGAIGTVGTLIAAIYIANTESRSRHEDAKAAAIIHAANMQHSLQAMRLRVEESSKKISRNVKATSDEVHAVIRELESLKRTFDGETIALLIPLGHNAALKLAGVQSALGNVAGLLSEIPVYRYTRELNGWLTIPVSEIEPFLDIVARQNERLWEVMTTVYEAVTSAE